MFGLSSIHSIVSSSDKAVKALQGDYDIPVEKFSESSDGRYMVNVHIKGGKTFSLAEIPAQCGWITMGHYHLMDFEDFVHAVKCLTIFTFSCAYEGMFAEVPMIEEWIEHILSLGFIEVISSNDSKTFYKGRVKI